MTRSELFAQIRKKQTYLCIGLDTDLERIPKHLHNHSDPVFEFNKQIIDATSDYCVAYKPNVAFYEAYGSKGWESLQKTVAYIPEHIFSIADAKRGDIGNTSSFYARAFFEHMNFDALTVTPYMGKDSLDPFLQKGKWAIVLAHTSNPGSIDFQHLNIDSTGKKIYEEVIAKTQQWYSSDQIMYVVGATRLDTIAGIRSRVPNHFFLVPGIGAQGGNLDGVSRQGMNEQVGLLVNASRSILYASSGEDFAERARREAQIVQKNMRICMEKYL